MPGPGLGVVAGNYSDGEQQAAIRIDKKAARCMLDGCDLEGGCCVYGDAVLCNCVVHDVTYKYRAGITADGFYGKGTVTLRRTVLERCTGKGVAAYNKAIVTEMEEVVVRDCEGGDFEEESGGKIHHQ